MGARFLLIHQSAWKYGFSEVRLLRAARSDRCTTERHKLLGCPRRGRSVEPPPKKKHLGTRGGVRASDAASYLITQRLAGFGCFWIRKAWKTDA